MGTALRAFLRAYGLVALVIAATIAVAWRFVAPPPPREVVVATGPADGAYQAAAIAWAAILAREGIRLRIRTTEGTVENLALLTADPPAVDLAVIQGGVANADTAPGPVSLGGIFFEPLWLLVRDLPAETRLADLRGRPIAVGTEGSGTRALALRLLAVTGLDPAALDLRAIGGREAARALRAGEVAAAAFVVAAPTAAMAEAMRDPSIRLVDFGSRADAYVAALPFLTRVRLPAGGLDLAADLPERDTTLVAPMAEVLARPDLHPRIVALMMDALHETHRGRTLFAPAGRFPTSDPVGWPLHPDADRYLRHGPGFLQRYLPFWVAVWLERAWVIVIPLIGLAIPLLRLAPVLWRWQIDRKVYRWYRQLRLLEAELAAAASEEERRRVHAELDRLADRVGRVRVPLSHANPLYELRNHIALVRSGQLR
ncbi:TAXI family TRAP transporter solute-binding subunit [Elioraea thermophila]|uniref:TAXI family TRAP transporter solute-binding subunit n=1 Tax=Elioraea thermophila TaxID=2185104 RepID=UPI000DF11B20|nr:TAXI family TRAP transporter solute-binding subunit [Elioraea thermophila]